MMHLILCNAEDNKLMLGYKLTLPRGWGRRGGGGGLVVRTYNLSFYGVGKRYFSVEN
jgi:hypothetical protein